MTDRLTLEGRKAANEVDSDKPFLLCVTLEHKSLPQPLRFVNNTEPLTRGGHEFKDAPFQIEFPNAVPGKPASTEIRVPDVSDPADPNAPAISEIVETLAEPLQITLEAVLGTAPEAAQVGPLRGLVIKTTGDELDLVGSIVFGTQLANEPYPGDSFDPASYPSLHKR